ncbi:hypothetical protein UCDDA912_g07890 [Diaporthe ampelina]|uniref:Uncharacterized protein n=1 Tax=Diaporthe ampelina TaxID=1214573 RepID=A0A0G2FDC6_9PEZI|nr:hypothetical protein UCDDA912_g07890 [Diaporthe ampelina]
MAPEVGFARTGKAVTYSPNDDITTYVGAINVLLSLKLPPLRLFNEQFYRAVRGAAPEWVAEDGMSYEKTFLAGVLLVVSPFRAHQLILDPEKYSYLKPASLIVPYFAESFWAKGFVKYQLDMLQLPRILRVRAKIDQEGRKQ